MIDLHSTPGDSSASQPANVFEAFGKSLAHAALQTPYDGVRQLVNHVSGKNTLPELHLADAPPAAEFGSLNWHAEQLGGAIGMIAPFLIARGAVRMTPFGAASRIGAAESMSLAGNTLFNSSLKEAAATGFLFDFAAHPVDANEKDFWGARFKNGLTGALTFTALEGGAQFLKSPLVGMTANTIGTNLTRNMLTGAFAGGVNAEATSFLSGNGAASGKDLLQNAYGFAFVGGGLGLFDKGAAETRAKAKDIVSNMRRSMVDRSSIQLEASPIMAALEGGVSDRMSSRGSVQSNGGGEQYFLSGRINSEGVWEPIRNISELPMSVQGKLLREVAPHMTPLFEKANVDHFIQTTKPVLKGFEPLPIDAPHTVIEQRVRALQDAVNEFARQHRLPEVEIRAKDPRYETALVSGAMLFDRSEGYIGIRKDDIYQNPDLNSASVEKLLSRLNHEFNHSEQVYLIFRNATHDMLAYSKTRNCISDFSRSDLLDLKESFEGRIGTPVSNEYFQRLLDTLREHPEDALVTSEERERAMKLTSAFVRGSEPGPEYKQAAVQVAELNKALGQLTEHSELSALDVLRDLQTEDPKLGQSLMVSTAMSTTPAKLNEFLTQSHEGEAPAELSEGAIDSISKEIDRLNALRQQRYQRYMLATELEAWVVEHRTALRAQKMLDFDNLQTPTLLH